MNFEDYKDDIHELVKEVAVDDEITFCPDGVDVFKEFLETAPYPVRKAALTLDDNGMLHPIWTSEDRQCRLAIQLHQDKTLEYAWSPDETVEVNTTKISYFWGDVTAKMESVLVDLEALEQSDSSYTTLRIMLLQEGFSFETGKVVYHKTEGSDPSSGEVIERRLLESDDPILDKVFYSSYGSPLCPRFIARDGDWLYHPVQYDGATWVERMQVELDCYLASGSKTPYSGSS